MTEQQPMARDAAFSYECHACKRCCHDKLIQVNPYEIARMARNRGISTTEFIERYLSEQGPYLRFLDNTACVFLTEQGCGVHPDRPLVCRLYPLGRFRSAEGNEHFTHLTPHPQSEGIYGESGTIADFLAGQNITDFVAAADEYLALFYRMYDALQKGDMAGQASDDTPADASSPIPLDITQEWLDLDAAIKRYCTERKIIEPSELSERLKLHITIIDSKLELAKES